MAYVQTALLSRPTPANTDYAAYLVWVAAGNTATPVPNTTIVAQQQAAVAAMRDNRWQNGGFPVGSQWFYSDDRSYIRLLGMVQLAANLPAGLTINCMDGTNTPLTPALTMSMFTAALTQESATFAACLTIQAAVAANPSTDITQGWPKIYGE